MYLSEVLITTFSIRLSQFSAEICLRLISSLNHQVRHEAGVPDSCSRQRRRRQRRRQPQGRPDAAAPRIVARKLGDGAAAHLGKPHYPWPPNAWETSLS